MRIVRYAYERNTSKYELEIDTDYIKTMNSRFDKYMGDTPHPVITMNMVAAVALHKSDLDVSPELGFHINPCDTLEEWIWEYVNEDIWESDSNIIDGETEDWEDDVFFDGDEEESYEEYVQMSIFDDETSPEGANDHN